MSEEAIERFKFNREAQEFQHDEDGQWVRYEDHVKTLNGVTNKPFFVVQVINSTASKAAEDFEQSVNELMTEGYHILISGAYSTVVDDEAYSIMWAHMLRKT